LTIIAFLWITQEQLAAESSTGTERKRKMKALVDTMNAEKAALEEKLAVCAVTAHCSYFLDEMF